VTHAEVTSTTVADLGVLSNSGRGDAVAKVPKARRVEKSVVMYMLVRVYDRG
jgi:hypothetical protein